MSEQLKPEKECPECGGPISWKTIHGPGGEPIYNGLCTECNIIFRKRETPYLARGRNLEISGEIGGDKVKDIHALDKRIMRLPCDVQIGILRERHRRELITKAHALDR